MYIYKITNVLNGMIYIGQTKNFKSRVYTHTHYLKKNKHANNHLQYSWNKYGSEAFRFEVLCECIDWFSADELEVFWIKQYRSNERERGFNKTSGGNAKKQVSQETKDLLSKINRANPSRPMLGKKHSVEARRKMMKKKHSDEEKRRMSERAKGRVGCKNTFYGKKHSEFFRKQLSNLKKMAVVCETNGKEYDCAKSASIDLNISQSYITHTCAGRHKQAKGYVFKYKFLGLK